MSRDSRASLLNATRAQIGDYIVPSTPFGVEKFTWPSLMAGVPGSRSELHYDEAGLPFWMAVLRGTKLFRILPYADNLHLAQHGGLKENHYNWPVTLPGGRGPGFAAGNARPTRANTTSPDQQEIGFDPAYLTDLASHLR